MLVTSSLNTFLLRLRGLSTLIACTGTMTISGTGVGHAAALNLNAAAQVEERVERFEPVGVQIEAVVFGELQLGCLTDVNPGQKVVVPRLTICAVHADGDGDVGLQSRIEPDFPSP